MASSKSLIDLSDLSDMSKNILSNHLEAAGKNKEPAMKFKLADMQRMPEQRVVQKMNPSLKHPGGEKSIINDYGEREFQGMSNNIDFVRPEKV